MLTFADSALGVSPAFRTPGINPHVNMPVRRFLHEH